MTGVYNFSKLNVVNIYSDVGYVKLLYIRNLATNGKYNLATLQSIYELRQSQFTNCIYSYLWLLPQTEKIKALLVK